MGWVESLQRAIDYMEDHLLDNLSIEDIAKQAHVSEFHFQRLFTILTDIPVGEYLRRRRLTLAAQELSHAGSRIIDIALKYGYDTPESFSKAFRKLHGLTPSQARKSQGKLKSYNRMSIQVTLKGEDPMNYKIVEKDTFKVVGVKREFTCENGENQRVIPKMWDDVHADGTNDRLFSLNNGEIKGVLGVCVDKRDKQPELMDYWIATAHDGPTPEGLISLVIPAAKWGVFEVHGPMPDAMQKAWKQIYSEWFPSSHYKPAGSPELEVYSAGEPWSPDYYSEIWIPLK
jgi:AraC family transcriptional regulator